MTDALDLRGPGLDRPLTPSALTRRARRHHGSLFEVPHDPDRDRVVLRDGCAKFVRPVIEQIRSRKALANQRIELGDTDCQRRLNISHRAVMPPSTNSRAPVM